MEVRTSVIKRRLKDVKRIIAVASSKGGVGKSLVASTLALNLAKKGHNVGLLDLDLYGPSAHIILGITDLHFPEEDKGIIPPIIHDIHFMSIVYFTEDKPAPGDIGYLARQFTIDEVGKTYRADTEGHQRYNEIGDLEKALF